MKYTKIILIIVFILCFFGCSTNQHRSEKELKNLCNGVNKCYRQEYAKDLADLLKSKKQEVEVATEGDEAATLVFKHKNYPTDILLEMKETLITSARQGYFTEVKLIGSDGGVNVFPVNKI